MVVMGAGGRESGLVMSSGSRPDHSFESATHTSGGRLGQAMLDQPDC